MTKGKPKNLAASVRQRLLDHSREKREDFQLVLTRYAIERLLFRFEPIAISQSIRVERSNAISTVARRSASGDAGSRSAWSGIK